MEELLKLSRSTIIKYLKQGTELGWCYYDAKEMMQLSGKTNGKRIRETKHVLQFSKDGIFIREYNGAKEASNLLNIDQSAICNCCCGNSNKTVGGYRWVYKQDYKKYGIQPLFLNSKKVICLNTNTVYDSISKAGKICNIFNGSISKCCNNISLYGGVRNGEYLQWQFYDEYLIKPKKIINNTKILEKLVNELLDLSKFQSGTVVLKKEPLALKQLTEDVISDMKNLAKDKKIKIKLIEEYKEKQVIEADYVKMRQLLTIFLDNAIKYSNEESNITMNISKDKISIIDTGIGIEKSKLEQLFERYYQVDGTKNGYGLGLCIAKYIADAHGYKILVNSVPNKGTDIHIIF
jgi:hypothetical protein